MFSPPIDAPIVSPLTGPWGHGQSGVPGDPIFLALERDGFEDSIGLSAAALWAALPADYRAIYLVDENTLRSAEDIITNIKASTKLNSDDSLLKGSVSEGYAQYQSGTSSEITDKAYNYLFKPLYNVAIFTGDSTIADYLGQSEVLSFITDTLAATDSDISYPGDTIAEQVTRLNALATRFDAKYAVIQVGLNDLAVAVSAATVIGRIQDYVDRISLLSGPSTKIILSKMTPCKARFITLYGATDGAKVYQDWLDVNAAIAGTGASPITGVDARVTTHADDMSDGSGNLAAAYDVGDHIHPNNAGRVINAAAIEKQIHLMFNGIAPFNFTSETEVELSTLTESAEVTLTVAVGGRTFLAVGGEVQIDGGEWVVSGSFSDGDSIKARVYSSAEYSTAVSATITTGVTEHDFSVTTKEEPPSETFVGGVVESAFSVQSQISGGNTTWLDTVASRRITIDGHITKVFARWVDAPISGKGVKFRVYRENGSNYEFVSESELIETGTASSTNEYTLATPMECLTGDILGLYTVAALNPDMTVKATTGETNSIRYATQNVTTSLAITSFSALSNYAFNMSYYGA